MCTMLTCGLSFPLQKKITFLNLSYTPGITVLNQCNVHRQSSRQVAETRTRSIYFSINSVFK